MKRILWILTILLCGQLAKAQTGHYQISFSLYVQKDFESKICDDPKYHYSFKLYTSHGLLHDQYESMNCRGPFVDYKARIFNMAIDDPLTKISWESDAHRRANNGGCGGGCDGPYDQSAWEKTITERGCTMLSERDFHNTSKTVYNSTLYIIYIRPMITSLAQSSSYLPEMEQVTITAPAGFPEADYEWEYAVGDGTYQKIPGRSGHELKISGRELMGDDYLSLLGANTNIKIRAGACPIGISPPVTLTPAYSSPHIVSVRGIPPSCYGDNTGSVKITFDRQLDADESLNISMTDTRGNNGARSMVNIRQLDAGNTVTFPADLQPGDFEIKLLGKRPFSEDVTTYTGDATHTGQTSIDYPPKLVFTIAAPRNVSCHGGSDGSLQLNVLGGSGTRRIHYRKETDPTYTTVPGIGGIGIYQLQNLTSGKYLLSVTDANGCTGTSNNQSEISFTIAQPETPLTFTSTEQEDPLAYGYTDGKITAYVKGGTAPYVFLWTNANGTALSGHTETVVGDAYMSRLNNLSAGKYYLTVRDANFNRTGAPGNAGCAISNEFELKQPDPLVVSISVRDSVSCNGQADGAIAAVVTGGKILTGTLPYKYDWYRIVNGQQAVLNEHNPVLTAQPGGQYQLKVTDKNNIEKLSGILTLVEPQPLGIILNVTPVNCYGGTDGAVITTVTGGTAPYRYTWSTGAATSGISNLVTGNYNVTVADHHNCIISRGTQVSQPALPLQIVPTPVVTYPQAYGYTDGSIQLVLKGGTPGYNITWKKADGTVLAHTGSTTAAGYMVNLNNLGAGDYTITVTDANHSTAVTSSNKATCYLEASFTLKQPDTLVVNLVSDHYVSCKGDNDGVLTAHVSGGIQVPGNQPYYYKWYSIVNGTPVLLTHTTATADQLEAGTYKVIVTDWNGISKESAMFVLTEPAPLMVQFTTRPVSCNSGNDGFVKTIVTGGTLPYSYSWSNGAVGAEITGITAGTYSLLLTDGHACQVQQRNIISEPMAPLSVADHTETDPLSFGNTNGNIEVTLNGGTPDANGLYNISWSDENGNALTSFTQTKTGAGVVTVLQGVGEGVYTIKVKDSQFDIATDGTSGCSVEGTFELHEPPLLTAVIREHRYVTCIGLSDGELAVHAAGGVPFTGGLPYKYQWYRLVNGIETYIPQTDSIIKGMPVGDYLVKVTDYNNITLSSPVFTLVEPRKLEITFTTTAVTCTSGMDGVATANVTGGTQPYHYEWTTGDTTATIKDINEGTYLLFVTDGRGCNARNLVDIYIPDGIRTDPVVDAPTCTDDCDGTILLNMSGGTAPYQYLWEDGSTGKDRTGLCAGKYTVSITDANSCKRIQLFVLDNPVPLVISLGTDKTICNGQVWTVNAGISDAGAKYEWHGDHGFLSGQPAVTFNQSGSYHVLVTDSKGCNGRDTINIMQYQADIAAEFVAPTQAFNNETVSFVNISYPAPEWVEWILPEQKGITLVNRSNQIAQIQFADTGFYNITMRAHTGDCEKVFTKGISILKAQNFPVPGGSGTPFIIEFEVMPNPNEGQFTVQVKLDKQSEIRLRMINIISNQLVSDRKESTATQFNIGYQLNIPAGTYLLLLETPLGNAIRKIVLNK